MSILTSILSGGITDLIKAGADIVDEFVTTDDERAEATLKLKALMQSFEEKMLAAQVEYDKEVTKRHANDMQSDSWLSKNVRPLGLVFMIISLVLLVYTTTFMELSPMQYDVLTSWIGPVISLVGAMVTFYYSSRGLEKIKFYGAKKH